MLLKISERQHPSHESNGKTDLRRSLMTYIPGDQGPVTGGEEDETFSSAAGSVFLIDSNNSGLLHLPGQHPPGVILAYTAQTP